MRGARVPAVWWAALIGVFLAAPLRSQGEPPSPSVGMRAQIRDLILPGPKLVARPQEDLNAKLVLRVLAVRVHGTDHRYDLEFYGLEPGRYDLGEHLMREDGTAPEGLPPIPVTVVPVLPPGQVVPHELESIAPPSLGGYRTLLILGGIVWVLGLAAILYLGRRKRLEQERIERPITLADRIRPAVESAQRGDLGAAGKAELERLLFAYWRRRLGLGEERIGRAMIELRQHDEAGPLLRKLEEWLHRPGPNDDVDVGSLLSPYRDVPADFDSRPQPAVVGEAG